MWASASTWPRASASIGVPRVVLHVTEEPFLMPRMSAVRLCTQPLMSSSEAGMRTRPVPCLAVFAAGVGEVDVHAHQEADPGEVGDFGAGRDVLRIPVVPLAEFDRRAGRRNGESGVEPAFGVVSRTPVTTSRFRARATSAKASTSRGRLAWSTAKAASGRTTAWTPSGSRPIWST